MIDSTSNIVDEARKEEEEGKGVDSEGKREVPRFRGGGEERGHEKRERR